MPRQARHRAPARQGRRASLADEIRAIRRDQGIILDLLTSPDTLYQMRAGKSLDDIQRDKAAELALRTGDTSYLTQYQQEVVARRGGNGNGKRS